MLKEAGERAKWRACKIDSPNQRTASTGPKWPQLNKAIWARCRLPELLQASAKRRSFAWRGAGDYLGRWPSEGGRAALTRSRKWMQETWLVESEAIARSE